MEKLSSGVFKVSDGEEITVDVRATGTLFGVNHRVFDDEGGPLTKGEPLVVIMDKAKAEKDSEDVPNARTTILSLLFNFSSNKGGRYDWTITGSEGGDPDPDFLKQAGGGPEFIRFLFHIV